MQSDGKDPQRWLVLLARMPTEPARHRMALWRELRRSGAVPLGQGTWAVPDLPAVKPLLQRLRELAREGDGVLLGLVATGHSAADSAHIQRLYDETRAEEWTEFRADCQKYLDELDKEQRIGKFTLAELEEEEQSLDRLRRWYRDLRSRDLLASPPSTDATTDLKACEQRFDAYADQVYSAIGTNPE